MGRIIENNAKLFFFNWVMKGNGSVRENKKSVRKKEKEDIKKGQGSK